MNNKEHIAVVLTSHDRYEHSNDPTGYWLEEVTHFIDVVAAEGWTFDLISPKGGKPPLDPKSGSKRDAINQKWLANTVFQRQLDNTLRPGQTNAERYGAIYFAGGHGAMWDFPHDPGLIQLAQGIYAADGIVAAVCHGVAGLLELEDAHGKRLIADQAVTGFSNLEEGLIMRKKNVPFLLQDELVRRGARFGKAFLPFVPHVATGNRLLTGQNPQSSKALGMALVHYQR